MKDRKVCLNCGGCGFDENDFVANDFYMNNCEFDQLSDPEKIEVYKQALKWSAETTLVAILDKPIRNLDEQHGYFKRLGVIIRE